MAVDKEQLSEYLVKIPNALNLDICKSLLASIEKEGEFRNNLIESDLIVLSDLVQTYLRFYFDEFFPKVDLDEGDSGAFTLELDVLRLDQPTNDSFNLGGENKSHRYLALTFIVTDNPNKSTLHFPVQEVRNIYGCGDLYISPPYFTHRFSVNSNDNNGFRAVSVFVRH
jgi:hypothetical protein